MKTTKFSIKSIYLILLLGFILRLFASQIPFIGEWDERFHLLVAKNLMEHPFKPTLYDKPVLDYDYKEWSSNHIWLSKPPLALWGMMASMKLFGVSVFSARLPSIIISTLSIFLTFLIGKKLCNEKIGLLAAFFHAIHGLVLETTRGSLSSDHVETLFLFFFELGLLLIIFNYLKPDRNKANILLIGAVIGLAFMCKWIVAGFLLVFWLIFELFRKNSVKKFIQDAIIIFIGWFIIAAPWLIYITETFPQESKFMLTAMFTPIAQTIQGHNEPWYFFLDVSRIIYGEVIYIPMIWLIWKFLKKTNNDTRFIIMILVFLPMFFLSMMQTKRSTYLLLSAPGFFVLSAFFIYYYHSIKSSLQLQSWLKTLFFIALIALPIRYSIERLKFFKQYPNEQKWTTELKMLNLKITDPKNKVVLFNEPHPIRAMFYSGFTAYSWIPHEEILTAKAKDGYFIYIKNDNGDFIKYEN